MNISLPTSLKAFIDEQVEVRGFSTSSEYIRALVRREYEAQRLKALLEAGAASPLTPPLEERDFDDLRALARTTTAE